MSPHFDGDAVLAGQMGAPGSSGQRVGVIALVLRVGQARELGAVGLYRAQVRLQSLAIILADRR